MEYSINYLRYTYTVCIVFIWYAIASLDCSSKLSTVLPREGIAWAIVIACGITYTCIYILSHTFIHVNKIVKGHSCPMIRQLIGWSIPPSFSRENATSLCTKEASFCPVIRKRGRILLRPRLFICYSLSFLWTWFPDREPSPVCLLLFSFLQTVSQDTPSSTVCVTYLYWKFSAIIKCIYFIV